jgi:hypothetical protein
MAALIPAIQIAYAKTPEEIRDSEPQIPLEFEVPDIIVNPELHEPDVEIYNSGAHFSKTVVTSTKPRTTSTEKFVDLPGARTHVYLPANVDALVNVAFTAESRCNEPKSSAPDWCELRILVDGVEAAPAASSFPPDTFAFDSTDAGTETVSSWEAHAMDRHRCVRNPSTTPKRVPVQVQWKVTNFDGGNAPDFWLDDWSLTIELARGCKKEMIEYID